MRRTGQAGAAWIAILQSKHKSLAKIRAMAVHEIEVEQFALASGHVTLREVCRDLGISERTWYRIQAIDLQPCGPSVGGARRQGGSVKARDTIAEAAAQGRADALAGEPAFAKEDSGSVYVFLGANRDFRVGPLSSVFEGSYCRECAAYARAYADALAALAEVPAVLR